MCEFEVNIDDIKKYVDLSNFYVDEINRIVELFKKLGIISCITSTQFYSYIPYYIEKQKELDEKAKREEYTPEVLNTLISFC